MSRSPVRIRQMAHKIKYLQGVVKSCQRYTKEMATIYRQKRDGVYYLIDQGRWTRLGKISATDAKRVLNRYELEDTYLRIGLSPTSKDPLREVSDSYLAYIKKPTSPKDLSVREMALERLCGIVGPNIQDVTTNALQAFFDKSGWSSGTVRRWYYPIKLMFDWALEHKYINKNPCQGVKLPKVKLPLPKHVDEKTLDLVMGALNRQAFLACSILRYSGLRPSECLKLKVKDIDLKNNLIHLHDTKTDPYSIAHLSQKLIPVVKELVKGKKKGDYLFPMGDGHQKSLRMPLRKACDAIKKKTKKDISVTPYQFRHTFLTRILKLSDLRTAQQTARHKNISTTTRYAWALEKDLIEAVNKV